MSVPTSMVNPCSSGTPTASTRPRVSPDGAGVGVRPGGVQRRRFAARRCSRTTLGLPFTRLTRRCPGLAHRRRRRTPARAWLAEVSAVVLQQALADANTAYRNFFASLKGTRKGPYVWGRPGSGPGGTGRSRPVHPQGGPVPGAAETGGLRLPGVGDVPVRWSRDLPSEPTSGDRHRGRGRAIPRLVRRTTPSRPVRCPRPGRGGGGSTWA